MKSISLSMAKSIYLRSFSLIEGSFSFTFGTFSIGKWSVKIIAYDYAQNMAYDEIEIFKIF